MVASKTKPTEHLGTFEFNPRDKGDVDRLARFMGALEQGDLYTRPLKKIDPNQSKTADPAQTLLNQEIPPHLKGIIPKPSVTNIKDIAVPFVPKTTYPNKFINKILNKNTIQSQANAHVQKALDIKVGDKSLRQIAENATSINIGGTKVTRNDNEATPQYLQRCATEVARQMVSGGKLNTSLTITVETREKDYTLNLQDNTVSTKDKQPATTGTDGTRNMPVTNKPTGSNVGQVEVNQAKTNAVNIIRDIKDPGQKARLEKIQYWLEKMGGSLIIPDPKTDKTGFDSFISKLCPTNSSGGLEPFSGEFLYEPPGKFVKLEPAFTKTSVENGVLNGTGTFKSMEDFEHRMAQVVNFNNELKDNFGGKSYQEQTNFRLASNTGDDNTILNSRKLEPKQEGFESCAKYLLDTYKASHPKLQALMDKYNAGKVEPALNPATPESKREQARNLMLMMLDVLKTSLDENAYNTLIGGGTPQTSAQNTAQANVDAKTLELNQLRTQRDALPANDPKREQLNREITAKENEIKGLQQDRSRKLDPSTAMRVLDSGSSFLQLTALRNNKNIAKGEITIENLRAAFGGKEFTREQVVEFFKNLPNMGGTFDHDAFQEIKLVIDKELKALRQESDSLKNDRAKLKQELSNLTAKLRGATQSEQHAIYAEIQTLTGINVRNEIDAGRMPKDPNQLSADLLSEQKFESYEGGKIGRINKQINELNLKIQDTKKLEAIIDINECSKVYQESLKAKFEDLQKPPQFGKTPNITYHPTVENKVEHRLFSPSHNEAVVNGLIFHQPKGDGSILQKVIVDPKFIKLIEEESKRNPTEEFANRIRSVENQIKATPSDQGKMELYQELQNLYQQRADLQYRKEQAGLALQDLNVPRPTGNTSVITPAEKETQPVRSVMSESNAQKPEEAKKTEGTSPTSTTQVRTTEEPKKVETPRTDPTTRTERSSPRSDVDPATQRVAEKEQQNLRAELRSTLGANFKDEYLQNFVIDKEVIPGVPSVPGSVDTTIYSVRRFASEERIATLELPASNEKKSEFIQKLQARYEQTRPSSTTQAGTTEEPKKPQERSGINPSANTSTGDAKLHQDARAYFHSPKASNALEEQKLNNTAMLNLIKGTTLAGLSQDFITDSSSGKINPEKYKFYSQRVYGALVGASNDPKRSEADRNTARTEAAKVLAEIKSKDAVYARQLEERINKLGKA